MNPKLIAIVAFSYLYVLFEIWIGKSQKRDRTVEKSSDKGSFWVLVLAISIGYALSFTFGAHKWGRISPWNTYFALGTILVIIGLIIRTNSILTLKQHFTYNVTKLKDHVLIETGLYKRIRHPGYLGQLIIFLGIATSMSNWLSVFGMMLPVLAGFIYRITVEERFMKEQLGQRYLDYQKRTGRLLPGIY
jgi:protein-S-isoprenylcysteine O-methyltransferase Ste14